MYRIYCQPINFCVQIIFAIFAKNKLCVRKYIYMKNRCFSFTSLWKNSYYYEILCYVPNVKIISLKINRLTVSKKLPQWKCLQERNHLLLRDLHPFQTNTCWRNIDCIPFICNSSHNKLPIEISVYDSQCVHVIPEKVCIQASKFT